MKNFIWLVFGRPLLGLITAFVRFWEWLAPILVKWGDAAVGGFVVTFAICLAIFLAAVSASKMMGFYKFITSFL